jgi:hypothetical protein
MVYVGDETMTSRKRQASKTQARKRVSGDVETVRNLIDKNTDVRLVLEIATRAHAIESREPPRNLGVATDVVVNPTNSQCPV